MRPFCLPAQMQGSFFRGSPSRLSLCVCTSVSRRISLYQIANCSDSGSSKTINPKPPPIPSSSSSDSLPDPALHSLVPLPSAARTERFRQDSGSSNGSFGEERFRSVGSRSEPSLPSIPGKFSKYSKPISKLHNEASRQKSERKDKKAFRKPMGDIGAKPDRNIVSKEEPSTGGQPVQEPSNSSPSALQIPNWMQQYQYSYSEVPTVPILGFRQTPWSPFGPSDLMERPWTGSAPLKPTKKKLPEFDSFNPPPRGKKGVKYVQLPGPFPPGQGPKPAKSREEILGEPLTDLEIQELVAVVNKHNKQVNLGRDGLTHNMLDVIHSHWKRSVCCKIKCKGVPTIDMDNVARTVEAKTGGVIIHRAGGVMYVFRGRNYNYKDTPKVPIMLWKPPEPIYPRLIQPIPEGLTDQETKQLRAKGRKVAPLCKLSKNGVYLNLVAEVRAQFEVDEVVRVDCEGMHATDYKKIGAKLKDLVPCTLLSFEKEQIIMCRKKPAKVENVQQTPGIEQATAAASMAEVPNVQQTQEVEGAGDSSIAEVPSVKQTHEVEQAIDASMAEVQTAQQTQEAEQAIDASMAAVQEVHQTHEVEQAIDASIAEVQNVHQTHEVEQAIDASMAEEVQHVQQSQEVEQAIDASLGSDPQDQSLLYDGNFGGSGLDMDRNGNSAALGTDVSTKDEIFTSNGLTEEPTGVTNETSVTSVRDGASSSKTHTNNVEALWQKAIEEGQALQLDNETTDPDVLFEAAKLSSTIEEAASNDSGVAKETLESTQQKKDGEQISSTSPFDVPPMGGLAVDELANLLRP